MIATLLLYGPIAAATLYVLYKWITLNNDYFAKRKIPHLEPTFLLGNLVGLFANRYDPMDFLISVYKKFPGAKFIGIYDFRKPMYIARDPEVIKQLTVKDYDYFLDHRSFVDSACDKLFGNSLFLMQGEKWRDMRATLSPAFTGSKMRQMFELVSECADDMATYFVKEADANRKIEWEMKDLFSRYTNDVIASCAFGLRINSIADRTNEFFMIGSTMFTFTSLKTGLRLLMLRLFPRLMKALDIEFLPAKTGKFFRSMVLDTMEMRAQKNIIRHDMINILMQVRSGRTDYRQGDESAEKNDDGFATVEESDVGKTKVQRKWSNDEIVAQAFLFFAAGFDTTSTMLTFAAYELAVNPDVQARLFEEVRETSERIGGQRLHYDALQKMKYMDQVVTETLRKWPPALLTDRLCNRDYVFDDGKDMKLLIEKGRVVWIPISAIHRDPTYWPEPEKFDPERFSDENKKNVIPGTFMPFGNGPRNCIGSRFALMEIKAVLYNILLHFSIEPTAKTQIPVKLAKSSVTPNAEKGVHVEFKPRKSASN